jgi:hypothetical protein
MVFIKNTVKLGIFAAALTVTSTFAQDRDPAQFEEDELKYTVASRQFHAGSGAFDVPLPGVECRYSGNNAFQLIITLNQAVSQVGAPDISAGKVVTATTTLSGVSEVTIELEGVENAQRVAMTVPVATKTGEYEIPVEAHFLFGDVNGDRVVNAGDAVLAARDSVALSSGSNYRSDVDCSGAIDKNDAHMVRTSSGSWVQ